MTLTIRNTSLTFELLADFGEVSHPLQHLWISGLFSVRRLQTTNSDISLTENVHRCTLDFAICHNAKVLLYGC